MGGRTSHIVDVVRTAGGGNIMGEDLTHCGRGQNCRGRQYNGGEDLTHCGRGQNCRGRQYNGGGGPHTLWAWSELQGEAI